MIIYQKRIYRDDLQNNPEIIYLFGDNEERVGLGGQAKECRGEPNAFGIPTKVAPNNIESSYWSDDDLMEKTEILNNCFDELRRLFDSGQYKGIIVPTDGLGTGLSELPDRAPQVFEVLKDHLQSLHSWFDN
jgi:hypothetical protein